ncbi:MAG: EAL domain-containing protein, partial [Desulfofustis sp.]
DLAGVETMMNAIFDRGYYKEITFSDTDGEVVAKRLASLTIDQVPDWFIRALPLTTPGGEALVMAGWKRAGSLYVESHPGYAYRTLWQTFVRILLYFLMTGVVVFTLGGIALSFLLRPLRRVEQQAEAIGRREYEIQKTIPKTRELKNVVTSMNQMTTRVRQMFEEQAGITEKLRTDVYTDPLTGLPNRRFLESRIDSTMADSPETARGLFLMIDIQNLTQINESRGYEAGDNLLRRCAEMIEQTVSAYPGPCAARLSGTDFGVFLPDADLQESEQVTAQLAGRLEGLSVEELSFSDEIYHIGGVYYNTPCKCSHLLAKADTALSAARHAGPNSWKIEAAFCDDDDPTQGKVWWRKTLSASLENRALNLYGQGVKQASAAEQMMHMELFSRITIDDDREVAAGVFIPLAERSAVITELDKTVVDLVLDTCQSWNSSALAINLSMTSVVDPAFSDWLLARLKSFGALSQTFFFEVSESSAVRQLDQLRAFADRIRAAGHALGIDHFGRSFSNFGYLNSLQPDYVKIDPAFTREIETGHGDGYFFIGALAGVAHSLDIKVIAEGIETEEQLALFDGLNID